MPETFSHNPQPRDLRPCTACLWWSNHCIFGHVPTWCFVNGEWGWRRRCNEYRPVGDREEGDRP